MTTKFPTGLKAEFGAFKPLNTPAKAQDFINAIPFNFEKKGETCRSPLMALRRNEAHCLEGAMLAAAVFWYHGERPLLLDLKTTAKDYDHVVTLFRQSGHWGATSKTNHSVLRYREPVYRTVRELAMSYFHEYFLDSGEKTLRSFSRPFDLAQFGADWLTSEKDRWDIGYALDISKHEKILSPGMTRKLRSAESIEIESTKATQYKNSGDKI